MGLRSKRSHRKEGFFEVKHLYASKSNAQLVEHLAYKVGVTSSTPWSVIFSHFHFSNWNFQSKYERRCAEDYNRHPLINVRSTEKIDTETDTCKCVHYVPVHRKKSTKLTQYKDEPRPKF